MLRHERSAPIWLFSFVDLAFLLLIAFTQIDAPIPDAARELATIEIPRIHGPGTALDRTPQAAPWQLRVHAPSASLDAEGARPPFSLVEPGTDAARARGLDADELAQHLATLARREAEKPFLAPHRDARAEDLLTAVSLLDDAFGGARAVAVRPGDSTPPVAAAGESTR